MFQNASRNDHYLFVLFVGSNTFFDICEWYYYLQLRKPVDFEDFQLHSIFEYLFYFSCISDMSNNLLHVVPYFSFIWWKIEFLNWIYYWAIWWRELEWRTLVTFRAVTMCSKLQTLTRLELDEWSDFTKLFPSFSRFWYSNTVVDSKYIQIISNLWADN